MSKAVTTISFAKLIQGRESSARLTDDGLVDLVDVVMAVTAKNSNHSNEVMRNLKQSFFPNEKNC
jgi:hypothetical protein